MCKPEHSIQFILDDQLVTLDFENTAKVRPDTNLLNYLRHIGHVSVKEGCGEGDCGACTVVIASLYEGKLKYKAINSCLVFLPMIHGCQVITAENLSYREAGKTHLHPVQQALVDHHGSQCGYCTPGIVMSLFALWKDHSRITLPIAKERLAGNLCRCTGYQPVLEAILAQDGKARQDQFSENSEKVISMLVSINELDTDILLNTNELTYSKPCSLQAALQYRTDHPEAEILSGATDIAVAVNKRKQKITSFLDISDLSALKSVQKDEKYIHFGSGISLEEMGEAIRDDFPAITHIISLFASHQIRNLATPGGNIAGASPIGDLLPVFMAHECEVELISLNGKRSMLLEEFIKGYHHTALEKDEILSKIFLPLASKDIMLRSYKISKRKDVDIATVSAAFRIKMNGEHKLEEVKLYYGGMAASIVRAEEAERFLIGKEWTEVIAIRASEILRNEFNPISDARSGAETRKIMAGNLLIRFWEDTEKL